jgi:hypothetical protein
VFTTTRHGILIWARCIQLTPSCHISSGVHLILPSHPFLDLPGGLYFEFISRVRAACHAYPVLHDVTFHPGQHPSTRHQHTVHGTLVSVRMMAADIPQALHGHDNSGIRVRSRVGARKFIFSTASRPTLGPTQTSYPIGTRGSFSGSKVAGEWSCPFTSTTAEV